MSAKKWSVNEQEYFEAPALSVLVFHNDYASGKQGGIELIQHGRRVLTNGDVMVRSEGRTTPPETEERKADLEARTITVRRRFPDSGLTYTVHAAAEGDSVCVRVELDEALSEEEAGRAAFAIELYPPLYWGKSYHMGGASGVFPHQFDGPVSGTEPAPMAGGEQIAIAPEDPERAITIRRIDGGGMALVDARYYSHHMWYMLRAPLKPGVTEGAAEIVITPNAIPNWQRPPVIAISQAGYRPEGRKRAVIELESGEVGEAVLWRVDAGGGKAEVLKAQPEPRGNFLRYQYLTFDFSQVSQPGVYIVSYGGQESPPFPIGEDVYQRNVWQPTLETFFPAQMCHVRVRDRKRVWHGACHLDDGMQAPAGHEHFDGYRMGPETDTDFEAFEHIPHVDRGGWHDAGDYDLAAGSQATATHILALAREAFGVDTDQTTVDYAKKEVHLHRPDGTPDIIEQVIHGVENLLGGYRASGHSFCGIISSDWEQYQHMGDAATMGDNLIYDPDLGPDERTATHSGVKDDRWVFTNHDTGLEYKVMAALAAAGRVLRGHADDLAAECIETAAKAWEYEQAHEPHEHRATYIPRNRDAQEVVATVELLLATGEAGYAKRLVELLPAIRENVSETAWVVARVLPQIEDAAFEKAFGAVLETYAADLKDALSTNPFGVRFEPHIWGVGWQIQGHAVHDYYLAKARPDLFPRDYVLNAMEWVLGRHAASDVSFVSGVGAHSITTAFGTNRAEFSYIPGGNVSGVALIRPDYPELKEDSPYFWQQSEYVMGGAATYIFTVLAADDLLNG